MLARWVAWITGPCHPRQAQQARGLGGRHPPRLAAGPGRAPDAGADRVAPAGRRRRRTGGGRARRRRAPADGRARGPGDPVAADRRDRLGDAARRRARPAAFDSGRPVRSGHGREAGCGRRGRRRQGGADDGGADGGGGAGGLQVLEIAIDALDAAAIRPFWQAVLGYLDEPGRPGPWSGLVDPLGQGPAVWFQRMDAPRPQRNRIHLDVSVPHDEAGSRISAALAAGGTAHLRRGGPGVLGAGRRRGQRGLHHDLAGPGLTRSGSGPGRRGGFRRGSGGGRSPG